MSSKQESWYLVEIEARPEAEEAVEFAFNELESIGTEINHLGKKQTDFLHILGYFNEKIDDRVLRARLDDSLRIYGCAPEAARIVEWREVENRDWLAEWKKHWRPTETRRFIIAPTWETVAESEKVLIRIEPSMAFGTGTHETTRLCLRAIEENYRPPMSFLDVGTGTGILAIAAAALNEQSAEVEITGCDVDEDSIRIARENAAANGVGTKIDFYVGSISAGTPASDFVCANLTADVIVPMLPLLVEKSRKSLVLSGILKEQEELVVGELEKLETPASRIETDGEWIAITIDQRR